MSTARGWKPLSWSVEAEVAREDAPIDPHGPAFPVIVFSHGSNNDPIDYAHTLELIAGAGFVVAAPYHVNNTQDDARIDYINGLVDHFNRRAVSPRSPISRATTGSLRPCSRTNVPNKHQRPCQRHQTRPRRVAGLVRRPRRRLHASDSWGIPAGTVTALTAAGSSETWGIQPDPRVDAIMGMAIGAEAITFGANLAKVTVPTVLVAGGRDQNPSVPHTAIEVSQAALAAISSADKLFVAIPNAVHRSFDSTYCAELQSAGAQAKNNPNAILDLHTVSLIAASAPGFMSGKAVHYCAPQSFTSPVNIQRVVASTPNAEYSCSGTEDPSPDKLDPSCSLSPPIAPPASPCATTSIPCTGLDTEEVKQGDR